MNISPHPSLGDRSAPPKPGRPDAWLDVVRQAVGTLRFGIVQIVVHDGQVTQIERTNDPRTLIPSCCEIQYP